MATTVKADLPSWWSSSSSILASAPTTHDRIQRGADRFDADGVAGRLLERGFAVVDNFLGAPAASAIRAAIRELDGAGALRLGKIQAGVQQKSNTSSRTDRIAFLPSIQQTEKAKKALDAATPTGNTAVASLAESSELRTYVAAIDGVRERLSQHEHLTERLGGSLDDCNFMCAIYPGGGARYVKHRDALPYKAGRKLTVIYYLNAEWQEGHGGELQIWPSEEVGVVPLRVPPLADRLLVFISSLEHEVLPSWRPRFALTTWMFNRQDTAMELLAEDMRQRKASGKLNVQALLAALDADSSDDDDPAESASLAKALQERLAAKKAAAAAKKAAEEKEEDDEDGDGDGRSVNKSQAMSVLMQMMKRKQQQQQKKG